MEPTAQDPHANYERKATHHEREEEFIDRASEALDRALRNIEETEQRMARNLGQGMRPDRKGR